MEVALLAAVGEGGDSRLHVGLHLQSRMYNKVSSGDYQMAIVAETLQVCLLGAIDVQMVGIRSGYYTRIGSQPMERAVKLVCFYHHKGTFLA